MIDWSVFAEDLVVEKKLIVQHLVNNYYASFLSYFLQSFDSHHTYECLAHT